jgi:hypothetical protein
MGHTHPSMTLDSSERIFPENRVTNNPTKVALSHIDSSVLTFSSTSAVWAFSNAKGLLSISSLTVALKKALVAFPAWCGQLDWSETSRLRLTLSYGSDSDPGASLSCYSHAKTLVESIPSKQELKSARVIDKDGVNDPFIMFNNESLAQPEQGNHQGKSSVLIQLTRFSCNGIVISVKLGHPLADATSMLCFVRYWAAIHSNSPLPQLTFDPSLMDKMAASEPDAKAIEILQRNRFDCWASGGVDCPPFLTHLTQLPKDLTVDTLTHPLGEPVPWKTWDLTKPSRAVTVYFSPQQLRGFYDEACKGDEATKISQHDALVAKLWQLVIQARNFGANPSSAPTTVNLDVTIGIRDRLSPPFASSFCGSPITLTTVALNPETVASSPSASSLAIRQSVQGLNAKTASLILQELSVVESPFRYWVAFFGTTHTIVTSWMRLGIQDVVFEQAPANDENSGAAAAAAAEKPYFVEPVMPIVDGCFQVMELDSSTSESKHWTDHGVCARVSLQAEVMDRFVELFKAL